MQKQAIQFIELLESQQLLSPDILEELRRQVAESKSRLTMELVAKLLVDNGHLTKFQATKLIAEIKDAQQAGDSAVSPTAASKSGAPAAPTTPTADDEELGFAPGFDEPSQDQDAEDDEVQRLDDQLAAVILDDTEVRSTKKTEPVKRVREEPIEVLDVAFAEVVPDDELSSAPGVFATVPPATRVVKPQANKANPYDSFRILGVGLLLALSLIAGFFLINYFWKGNADERLQRADEAYEQRSYETAANMYREFAEVFPANAKASYAKVRSALATLRKDSEGAPDPKLGLETALAVLPGISSEPSLAEQQGDLAGALIALAGKFNERADRANETETRRGLMADMEQVIQLIDDPRYVGANQRNQQAPTLNRILEDRQRILREINRDDDLTAALATIDQQLEAQEVLASYETRKALLNRYPVLETEPSLAQRVAKATGIQRALVQPGSLNIRLAKQLPQPTVTRSFLLAHSVGSGAAALSDQVIFVKVKGSVYGIDGQSGKILWRQFIGQEFLSEPMRVEQAGFADAIICRPEKGHIARLAGRTGTAVWSADLGQPAHAPVVEGNDLLVAAFDGTLVSLDIGGGQTRWTTRLPQAVPVVPGLAFGKPYFYQPAEHSNLYVLSRSDGKCQEVYYLGHRAGGVVVPPILLLGQLFVFENINAESCKVHVLATSDQGLELVKAQEPIVMEGNITVAPQVDGRRLIVQTDLGQIKVFDVEPTAEYKKVTEVAGIAKNAFSPKLSWLIANRNRIWIADRRLTRFDLQVASGKLSRAWTKNDGDRFVGPPQQFEDVIVHARTLRGRQGVRISAVDADTGDSLWDTDIGSPVALVHTSASGFDAVSAGGMLFHLDNQVIRNEADANPGQGKPAMAFDQPVELSNDRSVMFNRSLRNQLALYAPEGKPKLRLLLASFGSSVPTSPAIAVEDNLAIGLDSGQLVLVNPSTGAMAASPYQPPMEPGTKVIWNRPVYLSDAQTLIASSSLQKLVRLSVGDDLRLLNEVVLESPLVGPLVSIGTRVAGVQSTRSGDMLVTFDQANLNQGPSLPLDGRLLSGPYAIPDGCVLQTDSQLICISADAKRRWSIDFPGSPLVAEPTLVDDKLLSVTKAGHVWALDVNAGTVLGQLDAEQPLSSAPLVLPAGLLIGSDEGAVLALPIPTEVSR